MKKVIITADDFGYSESVNQAIVKSHREGILTSASLMVTGKSFDSAVKLAKENPGLAIGLHLVLICGKSVLPHSEIPDLVNEDKNFSNSPTFAGIQYYFDAKSRIQLEKEIRAQFNKFKTAGLICSHVDSHQHMHINPAILDILLKIAQEFGISAIRIPEDDLSLALSYDKSCYLRKKTHDFLFSPLTRKSKQKAHALGFRYTNKVYGLFQTGDMNPGYVKYLIQHLPDGISEIYFHPDFDPVKDLQTMSSPNRKENISNGVDSWYDFPEKMGDNKPNPELQALLDPQIKTLLSQMNIELSNYSKIQENA